MRRARPSACNGPHGLGELGHPFGEQTRVGRIGHIGRDDRGVGAHLVELDHVGRIRLVQQGLVQLVDGALPTAGGDLHQRGGVRHGIGDGDAAEASPGQGVGHLGAERLEAEPVAEAQEHHAQVGLHRDRRPAEHRVEVRDEGLEEDRVVEQAVDLFEPWWKGQELGREDCFPQGGLRVYLGAQHDGSIHSGKGVWSHRCFIRARTRAPRQHERAGRAVLSHRLLVSGGREPPPPALAEPYVTVSRHTAPTDRRRVSRGKLPVSEERWLALL